MVALDRFRNDPLPVITAIVAGRSDPVVPRATAR
jgi:hypothetical protein